MNDTGYDILIGLDDHEKKVMDLTFVAGRPLGCPEIGADEPIFDKEGRRMRYYRHPEGWFFAIRFEAPKMIEAACS